MYFDVFAAVALHNEYKFYSYPSFSQGERGNFHNLRKDLLSMTRMTRHAAPLTTFLVVIFSFFIVDCRFSFAEGKKPEKGSITFGAKEKLNVKTTPDFQSFKTIFADLADKVVPSVVSVIPTQIDTVVFYNNPFYQFFGDDEFGGSPFD